MEIVVTDGYTLNPGDLSWHSIQESGDVTLYERTPVTSLYERCKNAEIILTNKTEIRSDVINKLDRLKLIAVTATGYNIVDIAEARERNVLVCNVPAYGTASVAQHAFALLLTLSNHVDVHSVSVANGDWQHSVDWSYSRTPLIELARKTLGIVGLGSIGEQTARIGKAFGMRTIYYNRNKKATNAAEYVSLDQLFSESDFISLHCPLTAENKEFVNGDMLKRMKSTAFLINTARGPLVNEQHLADALNEGMIAGAALDVLSKEPPDAGNPLLRAKNCVITPHNAWMTKEARQRIMDATAENIKRFVAGDPVNIIN